MARLEAFEGNVKSIYASVSKHKMKKTLGDNKVYRR